MELYERVLYLLEINHLKRSWLAGKLGVKKNTFNSWFNLEKQDSLLPYFYALLDIFPGTSREWLFFGEGDLNGGKSPSASETALIKENKRLKKELEEERATIRKLINKMMLSDANPKDTPGAASGA